MTPSLWAAQSAQVRPAARIDHQIWTALATET